MDRTGQTLLGKYELTRLLGKGGMGEVWEGEHQLTGRRVAVKILSDNYLKNRKVVARFGREARAASSVHHHGIVEILDQDSTQDGVPFLVMEFLEGESLGARIKRRAKLSQQEALGAMLPLLDALDAAHRAGVVHRDLKPDNVFVLPAVRGVEPIKILDFGISRKADEIDHNLTQEGAVLGTPHYMSPEQARGEAGVDARADVYSAAVLLYECVVGDVPFDAGNYNALLQIILAKPPTPPRLRGAKITYAFEQALMATLHKDKTKRPQSARAFYELLVQANAQHEDAVLDLDSWTFKPATSAHKPAGGVPAFTLEGPPSGVRRAPEGEESAPRESGEFDFVTPSTCVAASPARAPLAIPPVPVQAEPLRVPAPPEPSSTRAAALAPTHPLSSGVVAAPQATIGHAPLPDVIAREPLPSVARAPVRTTESSLERGPSESLDEDEREPSVSLVQVARALSGWIMALLALLALAYVASLVFDRPDPRKTKATSGPSSLVEPPGSIPH